MCAERDERLWRGKPYMGMHLGECNGEWAQGAEVRQRERECLGQVRLRGGLHVERAAWVKGIRSEAGPRLSWIQLILKAEEFLVRAEYMSNTLGPSRIWGFQHMWSGMDGWIHVAANSPPPLLLRHEHSALQEPLWCRSGETKSLLTRRTEGSPTLPAPPPHHLQSSALGTAGVSFWEEPLP